MFTSLPRRLASVAGDQGGPSACRETEAAAAVTFVAAAVTFAAVAAFRYDCR
jgi:hypothetical protein